jgi:hypothetical protein
MYVKMFRSGNKNDFRDGEAIVEITVVTLHARRNLLYSVL